MLEASLGAAESEATRTGEKVNRTQRLLRLQKIDDPELERSQIFELTFPHDEVFPSELLQLPLIPKIPRTVLAQLGLPEFELRFRHPPALRMLMPKAPVDENDLLEPRKNDIRTPGELPPLKAVAESESPEKTTDGPLRLRILVADPAHALRAFHRGEGVHNPPLISARE